MCARIGADKDKKMIKKEDAFYEGRLKSLQIYLTRKDERYSR